MRYINPRFTYFTYLLTSCNSGLTFCTNFSPKSGRSGGRVPLSKKVGGRRPPRPRPTTPLRSKQTDARVTVSTFGQLARSRTPVSIHFSLPTATTRQSPRSAAGCGGWPLPRNRCHATFMLLLFHCVSLKRYQDRLAVEDDATALRY